MFDQFMPIHPKLVHFPIALFLTALGFEVLSLVFRKESFHKTAFYIYVAAALMSFIVVRSGFAEQVRLHLNHPVLTQHRMMGLWTMWVGLVSLPLLWFCKIFAHKFFRLMFILFLLSVVGLVTVTAHYGGRMVYEYGAGVQN